MRATNWARIFAAALIVACACRAANVHPSAPMSDELLSAARDTAVLSAVIRALQQQQEVRARDIGADPRPLLDEGGFPLISSEVFARVPPAILEARATALRKIGVQPVVATRPPEGCGGVLVPHPQPGEPDPKRNCPLTRSSTLAISLPRAGTVKLPPDEPYDRLHLQAAEGYWNVRVADAQVGPEGWSIQYYDVVMRREGSRWIYVMHLPLVIYE